MADKQADRVGTGETHGRSEGESQGGAYPNPHRGRKPGFDGGQTHREYEGPDNPNATAEE